MGLAIGGILMITRIDIVGFVMFMLAHGFVMSPATTKNKEILELKKLQQVDLMVS